MVLVGKEGVFTPVAGLTEGEVVLLSFSAIVCIPHFSQISFIIAMMKQMTMAAMEA